MIFKKRKEAPVVRSAKVISLVDVLFKNKVLKYEEPVFFIYKGLLIGKERKNIVKNLFFYAQIKKQLKLDDTLFIKELETKELLAVHTNSDGTIFL